MKFIAMVARRLREPSTLAGLSVLAVMFGVKPEVAQTVVGALGAVLAAGAVMLPESAAAK